MQTLVVDAMNDPSIGYDIIIISSQTENQAEYWKNRLENCRGILIKNECCVLSIHEDWVAGNGLGTLYAFKHSMSNLPVDWEKLSIAIYHTAGKGTRLAPLPASENNNKPNVKLPAKMKNGQVMTILEAVIKQTSIYAESGRIHVFWGDQLFIPCEMPSKSTHPLEILAACRNMPTRCEWVEQRLDKYGLIVVDDNDSAIQVEKVSFDTALNILQKYNTTKKVGISLGSFSIDHKLFTILLDEFSTDLNEKTGKLDTDPHFWMPMVLDYGTYMMLQNNEQQYKRINNMLIKSGYTKNKILGCIDVGMNCLWYDYGQIRKYFENNLLLLTNSFDAIILRKLLEVNRFSDNVSVNFFTKISEITNSLVINVNVRSIKGNNCIVYNIDDENLDLDMEDGTILAGLYRNGKHIIIRSNINIDSASVYYHKILSNEFSFDELTNLE